MILPTPAARVVPCVSLPAITLTDPYASLVVNGDKTFETRKGPLLSKFTGVLVIHRSLAPCEDVELWRYGASVPTRPAGWPEDDAGMALGVVLVHRTWRRYDEASLFLPSLPDLRRRACFEDVETRYLSELTAHAWFPTPIPAVGRQHRFTVSVPLEYLPGWALP